MRTPRYAAALTATALAYVVCHHVGALPGGLGAAPYGTRIADFIDLATPYLVLTPALLTLWAAQPSLPTWLAFALGSWVYADGHGLHLSANSVGNSPGYHDPPRTAHFWDEYVGHYLWYAGVAVVTVTLASTMTSHPRPRHPVPWLLAVLVGVTWCTNSIGGNMSALGLPESVVAAWWGWRHRQDLAVLLLPAGATAAVLLTVHLAVR